MGKDRKDVVEMLRSYVVADSRVPEPYFEFVERIKSIGKDTVLAVMPYGSRLNKNKKNGWLDAFVITSDTDRFHHEFADEYRDQFITFGRWQGYHAMLERIETPNYYHMAIGEGDGKEHFKYCPITIGDLEFAVSKQDYSLTGRFMKVTRIMEDTPEDIKDRLIDAIVNSMGDGLDIAVEIVASQRRFFDKNQIIYALLGLSYLTDRRVDKNLMDKVNDLYHNEDLTCGGNSYDNLVPAMLAWRAVNIEQIESGIYKDTSSRSRKRDDVNAALNDIRKMLGKNVLKAVKRAYKGGLTNTGIKEYTLEKAEKFRSPILTNAARFAGLITPRPVVGPMYTGILGGVHLLSELANIAHIGPMRRYLNALDDFVRVCGDPGLFESTKKDCEIRGAKQKVFKEVLNPPGIQ